jgi:hypothetical protein
MVFALLAFMAPLIRHLSFSEDRKNILVVYQYSGDLNISAIKYGDPLPKYGNLVTIPEGNVHPIEYAAWHGVNSADIGQSKVPDESVLYEDSRIDSLLKAEGVIAKEPLIHRDKIRQ